MSYNWTCRVVTDQRKLLNIYRARRFEAFKRAYLEKMAEVERRWLVDAEEAFTFIPPASTLDPRFDAYKTPSLLTRLRKSTIRAAMAAYHFLFTKKPMTQANLTLTYTDANDTEKVVNIPLDRPQVQLYEAAVDDAAPGTAPELSVSYP